jgi:diadenosine tetraphosphate (Ap4A) HIT family hydrolase
MSIDDRAADLDDPATLGRFEIGRAVLGQTQFLPGYSLLLCDVPGAERLTDLPRPRRREFLAAMESLGEAVEIVCRRRDPAFRRINLEILGNLTPMLHAHVWPRYEWEPYELKIRQVGRYPLEQWHQPDTQLGPQHAVLRDDLRTELAHLVRSADGRV